MTCNCWGCRAAAATRRDPLTAALVQYRRGDVIHSADVLALRYAGGESRDERAGSGLRRSHARVMAHLRERP